VAWALAFVAKRSSGPGRLLALWMLERGSNTAANPVSYGRLGVFPDGRGFGSFPGRGVAPAACTGMSHEGGILMRPRSSVLGLSVGMVLAVLGFAGTAYAETKTETFKYSGAEQTFTVPAGVTSIHVEAIGGTGGTAPEGGAKGGLGARVSGDLAVEPEQTLYIEVGGNAPTEGECIVEEVENEASFGTCKLQGGFDGGGSLETQCVFSPGGCAFRSGAGGGASDVRTVSIAGEQSPGGEASLDSRLLVAAGGGGGGGTSFCSPGGAGGAAEESGGNGETCGEAPPAPRNGGGAGTSSKGGAGGTGCFGGVSGALGTGAPEPLDEGGGAGGGGLYGGGSAGSTSICGVIGEAGGGGGGGSNLVPVGGAAEVAKAGVAPSVTITYTVVGPPVVRIKVPSEGQKFLLDSEPLFEVVCEDGEGGPGINFCDEPLGEAYLGALVNTGTLDTKTPGERTFSATAKSADGLGATKSVKYKVVGPPIVKIVSPEGGGTYKQGEEIKTSFSCGEGIFGGGLATCGGQSENGTESATGTGTLNTTELGQHEYTVTAENKEGLSEKARITYMVEPLTPACTGIHGWGRVGSVKEEGVLIFDELSMRKGARERFEVGIRKPGFGKVNLTALASSSCTKITGGREFAGAGPATLNGVPGYTAKFAFAVTSTRTIFSLTLTKGAATVYSTSQPMLKGAIEILK